MVPAGTPFRWWTASATAPVRILCTYAPGGFERDFVDMAEALRALGRPPEPADLATLAPPLWAQHGIDVVSR